MKRLIVEPDGWPLRLRECPPGFFVYKGILCLKSEYGDCEAYNEGGEYFWGGAVKKEVLRELEVQPCRVRWEEESDDR